MTFDVKEAMVATIDELEPMPDLVPEVVAKGTRALRLRRSVAAGGVALAVAAVVGTITSGLPAALLEPPVAQPATIRPIPDRLSYQEFRGYAAETLSAVLPDRFGPVTVSGDKLTVTADGATFPVTFELTEPMADFPSPGTKCVTPTPYMKGDKIRIEPGYQACQLTTLPTGGLAVARITSDQSSSRVENGITILGPPADSTRSAHLGVDHHGLNLRLYLLADREAKVNPPITVGELLAIAEDARFQHLAEVWSTHLSSSYQWVPTPTTPPTPR